MAPSSLSRRTGRATGNAWLRLGEAAAELGVSPSTLRRWSDAGKLTCYRSPGGHRRYRRADLGALLPAQMLGGVFEDAVLAEQSKRRASVPRDVVERGTAAASHPHDLEHALASLAEQLKEMLHAAACDVVALRGETLRRAARADRARWDTSALDEQPDVARCPAAVAAIRSGEPTVITDLGDPRLSDEERRSMLEHGYRSELCVPLLSGDRVIGLIDIFDTSPRDYAEYMDFLHSVGQAAAGILDEVDRSRERMSLVGDISLELTSSLDLEEVMSSTALRLCAISGAPSCDIYVLRDGGRLESVTSIDRGETDAEWLGRTFALDAWSAMKRAVETRSAVVVGSRDDPILSAAELALMEEFGERSALLVPLISRERVIGVLELIHREPQRTWSDEEKAAIVSICRFAALPIDNAQLYEGIKGMHLSNLKALSSALNAKDYYTLGHAARVAAYTVLLGQELGWPDDLLMDVEEAAYLHDIGKIGVSDRVLLKPSGLNDHEWGLMRRHPVFSAEIIQPLFDEALVAGVRHHHERWDGDGYPDGLAGPEIPRIARAMCVADSYDAMSFRRPYRQGLTYVGCLDELERCSGVQFDPEMVSAFRHVLDRMAQGRRLAAGIAGRAAAALTAGDCLALRESQDDAQPEHERVTRTLRHVRGDGVPARYLTVFARRGRRTVVIAHSETEDDSVTPHPGDEVVGDDELTEAFAGRQLHANVLHVDQWGVWISGVAPVRDPDGTVVAVVSAAFPAMEGVTQVEGLRSSVARTFASMLHDAAAQSGRSELEAITDGLTGLYNHRYFHERLSEELERCRDRDVGLALLFCDLDNFRAFNDLHGHKSGDSALRSVARVLEDSVRHVDLVARYGGEEFAAILIDTDEAGALEVAERIRDSITRLRLGADSISVSIGVATAPKDATFKDELVDKADWAMYLAKRRGRDKVMTFGADHGAETPEQAAVVRADHVAAMGELVAAREAVRRRQRSSLAHIALGVAQACGVPAEEVHAALAAPGPTPPPGTAGAKIVALAAAYQELVIERPYRARISEAEALDDLLRCPAMRGEDELARAFTQVLAR
ncbi:MAG: diguanylate cyclase [Actinobacteria bacterium]|nr:diguanylate cyclase [Actinomycetota bacterium]